MSRVRLSLIVFLIFAVGACGGGDAGDDAGAPADDGSAAEPAEKSDEAAATKGDPCRFATAEEVASATGVADVELAVASETCSYSSGDKPVLIYVYIKQGGKAAYNSQKDGAEEVSGIGDGALYFEGGGFYVLKGDAILNITALKGDTLTDDASLRAALEKIGKIAASRM